MTDFDWVVIGSGFGGSVCALRLVEKGYRVLVLEKGRRFGRSDFPRSNWNLRRWMWRPRLGLRGFFQMSFFEHVTVLSGVGVGGGSLVYANTLPTPRRAFFESGSWRGMANWARELEPHYATARRMLGVTTNPRLGLGDRVLARIAADRGRSEHFRPSDVGVFFGEPEVEVDDPYFGGVGPRRTGCTSCGGCMIGCRVGAKNTLAENYLYLAERRGARVEAGVEVVALRALAGGGYRLETRESFGARRRSSVTASSVVCAGGVLGTVPLLLRMREDPEGLPRLSPLVGRLVRTNNESLIGVIAPDRDIDFSTGLAITSIFHTDEFSHVEPVRYPAGSGFFRLLAFPHAPGPNAAVRLLRATGQLLRHPLRWARALTVGDHARHTQILLFMRTLEDTLELELGRSHRTAFRRALVTRAQHPESAPTAFIPEATSLARSFAQAVGGVTMTLFTETLLGVPTTAHILGGSVLGPDAEHGVLDANHEVYGHPGLYVLDGSALSANPGVNPALTITALAERAMSLLPERGR